MASETGLPRFRRPVRFTLSRRSRCPINPEDCSACCSNIYATPIRIRRPLRSAPARLGRALARRRSVFGARSIRGQGIGEMKCWPWKNPPLCNGSERGYAIRKSEIDLSSCFVLWTRRILGVASSKPRQVAGDENECSKPMVPPIKTLKLLVC